MTMRTGSLPDKGSLPRWARIAVALYLAVAVFAVRWLYPARRRALIALAAGTLVGLPGAAVTHG